MRGIVLAGGNGTRLYPFTKYTSKHLLPVYNKPMIYYPISTLVNAGIKDILIITRSRDIDSFRSMLEDSQYLGINIEYVIQDEPKGIAESFILAEHFIAEDNVALILGDNIFYDNSIGEKIKDLGKINGGHIFLYNVADPSNYGVAKFNGDMICKIIEKPKQYISNYCVTGLYLYDNSVIKKAKNLNPSLRGELEITDINNLYLEEESLKFYKLESDAYWFDTGNHESLLKASNCIASLEAENEVLIGSIELEAYLNGWVSKEFFFDNYATKLDGYSRGLLNRVKKDHSKFL